MGIEIEDLLVEEKFHLLPELYIDGESKFPWDGWHRLWYAVLEGAYQEYMDGIVKSLKHRHLKGSSFTKREEKEFKDLVAWLFDDTNNEEVGSLPFICDNLGYETSYIQRGLYQAAHKLKKEFTAWQTNLKHSNTSPNRQNNGRPESPPAKSFKIYRQPRGRSLIAHISADPVTSESE